MSDNVREYDSKKCNIRFETINYAQVEFGFNQDITFGRGKYESKGQDEYFKVQDKMEAKIKELCQKYDDVMQDNNYCTQGDGYRFMSGNIEQLEKFVKELSAYFDRFSCIDKY